MTDAEIFAEGYRQGVADAVAGSAGEQTLQAAWIVHLEYHSHHEKKGHVND